MKVLVFHSELGVLMGGGETFTRNLFSAFAARGHEVTVVFVADRQGCYPMVLPPCFHPVPLPGWWSRKLGQSTLSSLGRWLPEGSWRSTSWDRVQQALCWRTIRWHNHRFQRRVERAFAERWKDFDAVYVQSNVRLASAIARSQPTVLMLPGPVSVDLAPLLRTIPAVCAHDDGLAQMRAILGERVLELPLGLDAQLFTPGATPVRANLGWGEQHYVIGYVGRLTHVKGVDLLAAAFHELSQTIGNARLLIVGSGEEEKNMRAILAKECDEGLVHFQPSMSQEQLPPWYRAMNIMVMPSRYETLSNAVLEGLACGVPFLASNVGGNRKLGKTGAGWLFESESTRALSACLRQVLASPAEQQACSDVGVRYVRARYSWAASAERLECILTSQLGVKQ